VEPEGKLPLDDLLLTHRQDEATGGLLGWWLSSQLVEEIEGYADRAPPSEYGIRRAHDDPISVRV
jgi:hypothetical protein